MAYTPVAVIFMLTAHACHSASPAAAAGGPIAPLSIELEFKKPTLLPNKLTLSGDSKAFAKDAAAGTHSRSVFCWLPAPAWTSMHPTLMFVVATTVPCIMPNAS